MTSCDILKKRKSAAYRVLCGFLAFAFFFSGVLPPGYAQVIPTVLNLPVPGTMVTPSTAFVPVLLKGMTLHPENPLQFDFIVDSGNTLLQDQALRKEASKLFKYFLAALTVPEEELWVNLSPYEKDRVIPQGFGDTEMGRDLLAQDYLLKQLTASLMYPEKDLGKKFWDKVYTKAREQYGTTEIPLDTFNKVWIVPEKAVIYEQGASAFVVDAHLKVMLDSDYMAQKLDPRSPMLDTRASSSIKHPASSIETEIIREVILPEIEKEVNEGKTFANLRQIYNASILAAWYKMNLKTSLLGQVYADRNKTKGVDTQDKEANQKIYNQYIEAFKKGVYNYIKEDYDPATKEIIPRKYFSGGTNLKVTGKASILRRAANGALSLILAGSLTGVPAMDAEAMVAKGLRPNTTEAQAYQFAVNIVGLGPKADQDYIAKISNGTILAQAFPFGSKEFNEMSSQGSKNQEETKNALNQQISELSMALIKAIQDEDISKVNDLIKSGADVNAKWLRKNDQGHDEGTTPLIMAISKGKMETVKLLLNKGANVNLRAPVEPIPYSDIRDNGTTPLLQAASGDYIDIVKLLLDRGAEVDVTDLGVTPLFVAVAKGHLEVARILIEKGANINLEWIFGETVLLRAVNGRHVDFVKFLLKKGVKIDNGSLLEAAHLGYADILEELLKRGADANVRTSYSQQTPLMLAVSGRHIETVKILLKYEADVNLKDINGATALSIAQKNEHNEMLELLKQAGAKYDHSSTKPPERKFESISGGIDGARTSSPITIKSIAVTILAPVLLTTALGNPIDAQMPVSSQELSIQLVANNSNNSFKLIQAAAFGEISKVKALLREKNVDVNARGAQGVTALSMASQEGYVEIVEILIKNGANVNAKTVNNATALIIVSAKGHSGIVKILLDSGADVNAEANEGETALMAASFQGHIGIVKMLLERGADINARTDNGAAALMMASFQGHIGIIKILLERGVDINARTDDGATALMGASQQGHSEVVQLLLKNNAEVNFKTPNGGTALMAASKEGYIDIVKSLINKGAEVNAQDSDEGRTVLMYASLEGHADVVKTLLDNGADANFRTDNGWTALMMASQNGDINPIKMLLEKSADINIKNKLGFTALMIASFHNHEGAVKMLIDHGADVNLKENDGTVALHLAASNQNLKIINLLLDNGANVNTKDNFGGTTLFRASQKGDGDIVRLLLKRGANIHLRDNVDQTPLNIAIQKGHVDIVEILLGSGANANEQFNARKIFEELTSLGFMINPTIKGILDKTDLPLFHLAVFNQNVEIVRLFLDHDVDVNYRLTGNVTALMMATILNQEEIVKMLIENGANVNIIDYTGKSALDYAKSTGHTKIIRLLIRAGAKDDHSSLEPADLGILGTSLLWINFMGDGMQQTLTKISDNDKPTSQENVTAISVKTQETTQPLILAQALTNNDLNIDFFQAIANGETSKARALLLLGADINAKYKMGATALMMGIAVGDAQMVKDLLSLGADVNMQEDNGMTALMLGITKGDIQVVEDLLKHGAQIDMIDKEGGTALMLAAVNGHVQIVEILLNHGAKINLQDKIGTTALITAATKGHGQVVKSLLKHGAQVDIQSKEGVTALMMASYAGQAQVVEILLNSGAKVNIQANNGETALMAAVYSDNEQIIKSLLKHGAKVDVKTNNGSTALSLAKHRGSDKIIKLLKNAGAKDENSSGEPMQENSNTKIKASSPFDTLQTQEEKVGGIDLNPALLDLQIKTDGSGVPLPLPQQPVGEMHIEGFIPVIIHVIPIPNLPLLLGLDDTEGGGKDLSYTTGLGPMESQRRFEPRNFDEIGLLD